MEKLRAQTLILGVGNILLSDEGVGVRVVECLQEQALPENIELVDGGTAGADLIDVLADRKTVIIVDAVQSTQPAGTILQLTPEDLKLQEDTPLSLHDLDIPQTLAMTEMLNCAPDHVICFGIVPECVAPGIGLSETLTPLVPKIAEMILRESGIS
ncbi:MAG: hydrogenase maturation protease [Planctomycetota bacterium]